VLVWFHSQGLRSEPLSEIPTDPRSTRSAPDSPRHPLAATAATAATADRDSHKLAAILEQLLGIDALDLAGALNEACDIVSRSLHADKSCAMILDPSSDALVALGVSDTAMGRKERAIGMDRLPLANDGSTVAVYRTGVPHITGHADREPVEILGFTRGLGVRSIVETPLVIGSERRGVLTAMSATAEHFTDDDLRFLTAVARFVGLVAHRGELAEEVAAARCTPA
jgi:GAF domain-containing protein